MKIRIEMEEDAQAEVIIRCKSITPEIIKLQQILASAANKSEQFVLYKGDTEYYIDTDRILFFETDNSLVMAHTEKDVFETKMKLYELEQCLGASFQRISKSAIVNVKKIYSISRNLTSSSAVEFQNTYKQIYVSRAYYKVLKQKLEEKRYES